MVVDASEACVNRYEPAHEILIKLIALSSNEAQASLCICTDSPELRCSHTHSIDVDEDSDQKLAPSFRRKRHHKFLKEAFAHMLYVPKSQGLTHIILISLRIC